jgi:hypothetical protein
LLGGRSLGGETRSGCFIVHLLNNCLNPCFIARVDWPIIDLLHMIEHLFISLSYVLHFEWFKMLWERYLNL